MTEIRISEDVKIVLERIAEETGINETEVLEDIVYGAVYGDWGQLEGRLHND